MFFMRGHGKEQDHLTSPRQWKVSYFIILPTLFLCQEVQCKNGNVTKLS